MTADWADFNTPAEHARQMLAAQQGVTNEIAALVATGSAAGTPGGVPLLTKNTVLFQDANPVPIAATSGLRQIGGLTVSQIGYEILISLAEATVPGNGLALQVQLAWYDTTTNQNVNYQNYYVLPGNSAAHVITGTGPSQADRLFIFITNNDNVVVNSQVTVLNNSRVYNRHEWLTRDHGTFSTFTTGNDNLPGALIIDTSPSLAAGGTASRIMPLCPGRALILFHPAAAISGSGAVAEIHTLDPTATSPGQVAGMSVAAGAYNVLEVILPRAQCFLKLNNNGSATGSLGCEITRDT